MTNVIVMVLCQCNLHLTFSYFRHIIYHNVFKTRHKKRNGVTTKNRI